VVVITGIASTRNLSRFTNKGK